MDETEEIGYLKYENSERIYQFLTYEILGSIAKITFNRPEAHNALSPELYDEAKWALIEAEIDPKIKVIVFTGAGDSFSSGGDLKRVLRHHRTKKGARLGTQAYMETASNFYRQVEELDKVVISMVNGAAQAGGFVLCEYSDIVIASEKAWFQSASVMAGIADNFSCVRLPYIIGFSKARYLLLTGATIDAKEAEKIGLVTKVVPHDDLWSATLEVANQVMRTGPNAKKAVKRMITNLLPKMNIPYTLETEISEECNEAVDAFVHKRKPKWAL